MQPRARVLFISQTTILKNMNYLSASHAIFFLKILWIGKTRKHNIAQKFWLFVFRYESHRTFAEGNITYFDSDSHTIVWYEMGNHTCTAHTDFSQFIVSILFSLCTFLLQRGYYDCINLSTLLLNLLLNILLWSSQHYSIKSIEVYGCWKEAA